ncbi:MAG TPA: BPSS1780 family membrane protein [Casimicrobiaceae bacterium]|nr:BPSS1780 family membrane protein [Casimicrobiaceae bacterium]
MSNQPIAGDGRTGTPSARTVDADRGLAWWSEAWRLFTPAAGVWLLVIILLIVLNMVLTVIPLIGHVIGQLLFPIFAGGLMLGCRAVDRGEPLTVGHLFAGFGTRTGPLFIVGLIYTAVAIGIALVVFGLLLMIFGATIVSQLWHLQDMQDPWTLAAMFGSMLLAICIGLLVFLLLYLPLVMAVWFAPALVVLRGVEPLEAMRLSFSGCLRNVVPFLLYGLVGLGLAIVATIPLLLGWLVLGPVTIASLYTSYCDIYEDRLPTPAVATTPAV